MYVCAYASLEPLRTPVHIWFRMAMQYLCMCMYEFCIYICMYVCMMLCMHVCLNMRVCMCVCVCAARVSLHGCAYIAKQYVPKQYMHV